jgi:alpha-methylacyl-CoA racemase
MKRSGPLGGLKIVEFAGLGPAPFCGMLLADLGADVIRIDRAGSPPASPLELEKRGRRSVALDLKAPGARELCLSLIEQADAVIEGYRPGVMERLGLGPDVVLDRNPRLVFGRMTGWGQEGPLANSAGHDINYIALSGALAAIGSREKPIPPLNLVGDLGGGALYLAFGLLAGIIHARATGEGQVIDCSMVEGAASLMTPFFGALAAGLWTEQRADNMLDGGAAFYGAYECADGEWISIGPLEPQFHSLLLEKLELDAADFTPHLARDKWPEFRARFETVFRSKTRAQWSEILEGTDVCFAPVLSMSEAPKHPHNEYRQSFVELGGVVQPGPVPRFSRTPGRVQGPPPGIGAHNDEALADWGFDTSKLADLRSAGVFG